MSYSREMFVESGLICEFASVRQGQLTVVNTFDTIKFQSFPSTAAAFFALVLRNEAHEMVLDTKIEVRLVGPDGVEIAKHTIQAKGVTTKKPGVRPAHLLALPFPAIAASQPGAYEFEVRLDGDAKSSFPLYVEYK